MDLVHDIGGRGRAVARPAVVLAVLIGLLFMHGSVMGATGCESAFAGPLHQPAGMPMPALGVQAATMAMAHPARAAAGPVIVPSAKAAGPLGHGSLCLTDQPRVKNLGAGALGMALVFVLAVSRRLGGHPLGRSSRGPPISGIDLLTRLCISRT